MKNILYLLIIFSLLCATSCTKEDIFVPPTDEDTKQPSADKKTGQTLFMYMPWSSDLTDYFKQNLADFETVIEKDILKNERILIFFASSPSNAVLFEMKYDKGKCVRDTLQKYQDPDFPSTKWITSILNDVKNYSPANRYAMIISSHGMGWLPVSGTSLRKSDGEKEYWEYEGVPLTRFFGGTTAEYQVNTTTFAEAISNAGMKMEYIMFDDCYMSSIEVAYDLKEVTDYLIASPTEVMAYGFPYHIIGQYLVGDVDYEKISDGFYSFYQSYSTMPCGTIGVTKCSELDNLASVMKEINQRYTFEASLINDLQRLDGYTPVIFFDYGDYVSKLCSDESLLAMFEAQLDRTVPPAYRKHTPNYYSMGKGVIPINTYSGVTISDPSVSSKASAKTETAWYKATH